jgi:4-hydroxy-L-threonine phosphate dehydrogenase PdxA
MQAGAAYCHRDGPECVEQLCKLPAVQQLSSNQVVQMLKAAVSHCHAALVEQLCKLPAAKRLSSEAMTQLLQAAQQLGDESRSLCIAPLQCLLAAATKAQQTGLK